MSYDILLILTQFMIFSNKYDFVTAKALIGHGIAPAEGTKFSSVVCIANRIPIDSDPDSLVVCTGVLISSTHLLTAEHCVDDQSTSFQVLVGSTDLRTATIYYPFWWLTFDWWASATGQPVVNTNDIAVTRLIQRVPDEVIPAMLIYQPNSAYVGSKVIVAGWGTGNSGSSSSILQRAKLNIISNTECEKVIFEIDGEKYRIHDKFICSIKKPFAFLADGDSGGPLFFEKYVIGISQGTCPKLEIGFHPQKTNMHSSVNHYRYFIIHAVNMY